MKKLSLFFSIFLYLALSVSTAYGQSIKKGPGNSATIFFKDGTSENIANMTPEITTLDDASATRLGYKSYSHGVTYNGGNAPTIAGTGLSSVEHSQFIPYQMQNGSWRLKGNFTAVMSSATRSEMIFTVAGIAIAATQSFSGSPSPGADVQRVRAYSTNNFAIAHISATTTAYYAAFDIALSAKPTWAY